MPNFRKHFDCILQGSNRGSYTSGHMRRVSLLVYVDSQIFKLTIRNVVTDGIMTLRASNQVLKKYIFFLFFLTALNWSKCILMVSLNIWLSAYTNKETLRIIWNFDLSSWGVLGRIYA